MLSRVLEKITEEAVTSANINNNCSSMVRNNNSTNKTTTNNNILTTETVWVVGACLRHLRTIAAGDPADHPSGDRCPRMRELPGLRAGSPGARKGLLALISGEAPGRGAGEQREEGGRGCWWLHAAPGLHKITVR